MESSPASPQRSGKPARPSGSGRPARPGSPSRTPSPAAQRTPPQKAASQKAASQKAASRPAPPAPVVLEVDGLRKVFGRATAVDGVSLTVRQGSTTTPGMVIARIQGTRTVWAEGEVPESQAALLQPDAPVKASSPGAPGQHFEGHLQALLPQVNPATRTVRARLELANPQAYDLLAELPPKPKAPRKRKPATKGKTT